MENKNLEKLYKKLKEFDATYHELFYENTINKNYYYLNSKLEDIQLELINGVGITLNDNEKSYYGSTNNFNEIESIIEELGINFKKNKINDFSFNYKNSNINDSKSQSNFSDEDKKLLMNEINDYVKNYNKLFNQVIIRFNENEQNVKILSNDNFVTEKRLRTRIVVSVFAEKNNKVASSSTLIGYNDDYSFLDKDILYKKVKEVCDETLEKFECVSFKGGNMPAVISNEGAVIFHEACGHALESYSISNKTSVLTDKVNKKVANEKVTIIDDGCLDNLYGSTKYDDQGVETRKNILIKNGILKDYLTDIVDGKLLNTKSTGSARRNNYKHKATSRMNNTYLEVGSDNIEDMIKSTKYGIYAKKIGGGSVSPNTGEFNFNVSFGYIIKDGKIDKPIKNISLIGSALEILDNVVMVSNDIEFCTGHCGAESGWVPVTTGEPTIKVSNILVGGSNE